MSILARPRLPPYLPLMAVVTGLYLTVEIPFSVHLVDVLGGNPSAGDVDAVERFGRILTGVAVAIAVMGGSLAGSHRAAIRYGRVRGIPPGLRRAAAVGLICVGATYYALDLIAAAIGDNSSGVDRRNAVAAIMTRHAVARSAEVSGDLAPSWRALVSTSPVLDPEGRLPAIMRMDRSRMIADEAARRLGTAAEFRDGPFRTALERLGEAFAQYEAGAARYDEARKAAEARIHESWAKYLGKREASGTMRLRSREQIEDIRRRVRMSGVPVRADWHPNDRAGFEAAMRPLVMSGADAIYEREIEKRLGEGALVRPGLSYEAFVATPAVQRLIRRELGLPEGGAPIGPKMDAAQFERAVYRPALASMARTIAGSLDAHATAFVDGARYADVGRMAMQSAHIPTMAILLSLAGAFLHVCKLSGFLAQIVGYLTPAGFLRGHLAKWSVGSLAAAALAAAMLMPANAVTDSDPFARIRGASGPLAAVIEASIDVQPGFRTLGDELGSLGGWSLIEGSLPAARPFGIARRD